MTFSTTQRRAAAEGLGNALQKATPDWGNMVAGSDAATRIDNACRIARNCCTQQRKANPAKPMTPG